MYPTRYDRTTGRFPSLFDDLFRDEVFNRFFQRTAPARGEPDTWSPSVDIKETDKAFTLCVDLPGVDRDAIKVNVDRGVLTINAEMKQEETKEGETWHVTERRYGSFQRSFRLPETIDATKVQAQHKNGVLELMLPKAPTAAAHTIPISG